jgi:hypothetical protein
VSKREAEILKIKKYLNGELDAKAMHRLERQAQDDPFLMDALEGYERAESDQQANLNDLSARIKRRVTNRNLRIIPWMLIGIAASVLIICAVGVWWLNNNRPANEPKLAVAVKPVEKTIPAEPISKVPSDKKAIAAFKKIPHAQKEIQRSVRADKTIGVSKNIPDAAVLAATTNIKDSVPKDTTPLNEMVVMGYATQKKKDIGAPAMVAGISNVKKPEDTISQQLLQGQAAGVTINNNAVPRQQKDLIINGKTFTGKSLNEISTTDKSYKSSKKIINGRVVANDDGLPIPGVSVKVAGTNIATQTDANGRFNLSVDSSKTTLVVGYIGYQTLKVSANNRDSIKTIALSPTSNSLNEVVVTGYTSQKNTEEPVVIYAHPQTGWNSFRKYLKKNAVSPDGKKGIVKLSFMVDHNGVISTITIKNGLSPATNQKAIDLINDGPGWIGNTNGEPEKVNLRIKFAR